MEETEVMAVPAAMVGRAAPVVRSPVMAVAAVKAATVVKVVRVVLVLMEPMQ